MVSVERYPVMITPFIGRYCTNKSCLRRTLPLKIFFFFFSNIEQSTPRHRSNLAVSIVFCFASNDAIPFLLSPDVVLPSPCGLLRLQIIQWSMCFGHHNFFALQYIPRHLSLITDFVARLSTHWSTDSMGYALQITSRCLCVSVVYKC